MLQNKNEMLQNKKIIPIIAVLLLIGASVAFFVLKNNQSNNNPSDTQATNDTQTNETPVDTPQANNIDEARDDKVIIPSAPSESTSVEKPVITRAEQSGDYIRVSAILENQSNGTCEFTATKTGSSSIIKAAAVILAPSYYTCNGFRIPVSEFKSSGDWTVTITHVIKEVSNTSDSKIVTIQ